MKRLFALLSLAATLVACGGRAPEPKSRTSAVLQEQSPIPEGFTGTRTNYYPGGQVESTTEFVDGVLCGLVTGYYENGVVRYQYTERNGKREGPMTVYYRDGAIRLKYDYIEGTATGDIYSYYPNGQTQSEVIIGNTLERSDVTFYYENGIVSEKYSLINGHPDGEYVSYFKDGTVRRRVLYRKGVILKER